MRRNLFLTVTASLLISLFSACNEQGDADRKPAPAASGEEDDYNDRISNIVSYLEKNHQVDMDSCRFIIVLQTNKCNACTKATLDSIFNEISMNKISNPVFVLHTSEPETAGYLSAKSGTTPMRILIDKNEQLDKTGLSFMKNIFISTCNKKVNSWKFYN
jgi:hypothetical protein